MTLGILALVAGLYSCDDRMPVYKEIPVEEVILDESIAEGVELEVGSTLDIAALVSVDPVGAQDKAEYFTSSDASVAVVSEMGVIEAVKVGTATITVTVSGIEKTFTVKVIPVKVTPVESISALSDIVIWVDETADVLSKVSFTPAESSKDLKVTMEDNPVASLTGTMVRALSKGVATVVVSSITNPEIKAELKVKVPSGDYSRAGWSVVASTDVPGWTSAGEHNSLTAPIDGDYSTIFCQIRPGKSYSGMTNATNELWFYLDLGTPTEVNYFHITWRYEAKELFCRVYMFDGIYGSDDAVNWTPIASAIFTEAEQDAQDSPILYIPKTKYRYYKFDYASQTSFTNPATGEVKGGSSQINEIFLGLNEYYEAEIVQATAFEFDASLKAGASLKFGQTLDLTGKYTITPSNTTSKTVVFSSSDVTVASVSSTGLVTALSEGTTTITGSIDGKSDSFNLTVTTTDYSRAGWSVVASLDISGWTSSAEKNSLTAAIDGDLTTNFCQVRPGKSISGVSNTTSDLWFYLDMGEAKDVDYFRIVWRYDNKELFCRVYMFDEILGSNDAATWTSIATNVYTHAEETAQNSPMIELPKTKYRYYKFDYHSVTSYTNPSTGEVKGSSSQINEIYLGAKN